MATITGRIQTETVASTFAPEALAPDAPPVKTAVPKGPILPSLTNIFLTDMSGAVEGVRKGLEFGHREAVVQHSFQVVASAGGFTQSVGEFVLYALKAINHFKLCSHPILPYLLYPTNPFSISITALGLLIATIAFVSECIGIIKTYQFKSSIFTDEYEELMAALEKFDKAWSDENSIPRHRYDALERLNQAVNKAEQLGKIGVSSTGESLTSFIRKKLSSASSNLNSLSKEQEKVISDLEHFRNVCAKKERNPDECSKALFNLIESANKINLLDKIVSPETGTTLKNLLDGIKNSKDNTSSIEKKKESIYNKAQSLNIADPNFFNTPTNLRISVEKLKKDQVHQIFIEAKHAVLVSQLSKLNDKYLKVTEGEKQAIRKLVSEKNIPTDKQEAAVAEYIQGLSVTKKSRLAYRIHPWLADEMAIEVPILVSPAKSSVKADLNKPVEKAERIMTHIKEQTDKQYRIHIIGIITVLFIVGGLIAGTVCNPALVVPLIVVLCLAGGGVLTGTVRQALYYGYLSQKGTGIENFSKDAFIEGVVPEFVRNFPKAFEGLRQELSRLGIRGTFAEFMAYCRKIRNPNTLKELIEELVIRKIQKEYDDYKKQKNRASDLEDLIDHIDETIEPNQIIAELNNRLRNLSTETPQKQPKADNRDTVEFEDEYVATGRG